MKIFQKISEWLRENVPVTPPDKSQHQNLTEMMIWLLFIPSIFISPVISLWVLLLIMALAWVWEIPSLKKSGYKRAEFIKSLKDVVMTFKMVLPFWIVIIYFLTKDSSQRFLDILFFQ